MNKYTAEIYAGYQASIRTFPEWAKDKLKDLANFSSYRDETRSEILAALEHEYQMLCQTYANYDAECRAQAEEHKRTQAVIMAERPRIVAELTLKEYLITRKFAQAVWRFLLPIRNAISVYRGRRMAVQYAKYKAKKERGA